MEKNEQNVIQQRFIDVFYTVRLSDDTDKLEYICPGMSYVCYL